MKINRKANYVVWGLCLLVLLYLSDILLGYFTGNLQNTPGSGVFLKFTILTYGLYCLIGFFIAVSQRILIGKRFKPLSFNWERLILMGITCLLPLIILILEVSNIIDIIHLNYSLLQEPRLGNYLILNGSAVALGFAIVFSFDNTG